MIPEEYVTLPTAKLLRDAGFPKDGCSDIYQEPTGRRRNGPFGREDIYDYIPKPTQAQAMRWLREEKRVSVRVNYSAAYGDWFYDMLNLDTDEYYEDDEYWSTVRKLIRQAETDECKRVLTDYLNECPE